MNQRKNLSDILRNNDRDSLRKAWQQTEAAGDFAPLPKGEYTCRILSGELFNAKTGTPGYKLTFEVSEGEHESRRIWLDIWLTQQALPMAKRDLAKLGVVNLDQLENPLPHGMLAKVKLTLRRDDDGKERNRVSGFDVIGLEPGDAYEPKEDDLEAKQAEGKASAPPSPARDLFGSANGQPQRAERF